MVTIAAHGETTTGARELTIELWSGQPLIQLTLTPRNPGQKAIQVEWARDGLHLSTGGTVKDLELNGSFRVHALPANGEKKADIEAAGKWSITFRQHSLRLLLTLPSEDYVMAALNGEAAPDEPMASLKAMAISMRTFALVNAARHRADGFDLCDNTHCQALRLERVRNEVSRAVRETAGETLWFHGQRAHVYYTQHCGGANELATNVWPAEQAGYLSRSHADPYCVRRSAAAWHARIPLSQLNAIFHAQGWRTPFPIATIRVTQKTASGRARLIEVTGRGAAANLSASSVRFAVDRTLGWNQMRSDWYTATVWGDSLDVVGKGYGHGVGLCQAGAYEMAAEGHSETEILAFYFPGTRAGITPTDQTWQSIAGNGWSLLTTMPTDRLLAEGDAAWSKARSLMGGTQIAPRPTVQEFPSTELFRQTTNEPGWMLASTRGANIFLQPPAVRQKSGGDSALLLHEFLHVLIEGQAGGKAPLWLREGLVEVLADPVQSRAGSGKFSPEEVDATLAHPSDATASRQAHKEAEQMTERLLARYGMPAVREFLRAGVPSGVVASL
jgi:stage II sporulation protein D